MGVKLHLESCDGCKRATSTNDDNICPYCGYDYYEEIHGKKRGESAPLKMTINMNELKEMDCKYKKYMEVVYRVLKEIALKQQDFELAAKMRDKEKESRNYET